MNIEAALMAPSTAALVQMMRQEAAERAMEMLAPALLAEEAAQLSAQLKKQLAAASAALRDLEDSATEAAQNEEVERDRHVAAVQRVKETPDIFALRREHAEAVRNERAAAKALDGAHVARTIADNRVRHQQTDIRLLQKKIDTLSELPAVDTTVLKMLRG